MTSVSFFVPGEPLAKARHRSAIRSKKDGSQFISNYTDAKFRKNEESIAKVAKPYFQTPFDCPLELRAVFVFPLPDSWSGKKKDRMAGQYKASGADLDNYVKQTLDGLNRKPIYAKTKVDGKTKSKLVGYDYIAWTDDTLVVRIMAAKRYTRGENDPVGINITIAPLEPSGELL